MKRLSLREAQIRNVASSTSVYQRGQRYYQENRVNSLRFDDDNLNVKATVVGDFPYEVEVALSPKGELRGLWCDCPAFSSYDGACKHIVAVLLSLQRNLQNEWQNSDEINRGAAAEIINMFSILDQESSKTEVTLDITLEAVNPAFGLSATLELKIGRDRLYVIKDIEEFLNSLINHKSKEFGKRFIFQPEKHTFNGTDQPIIEFLCEILASEQANSRYAYSTLNSAFQGKSVKLNDYYMKRLLDLLKERTFNFRYISGPMLPECYIRSELPVTFALDSVGEGVALVLDTEEPPFPITSGGEYFYFRDGVYQASDNQKKYFVPLLRKYLSTHKKVVFSGVHVQPLVSEVLPLLEKVGSLKISPQLQQRFCKEELVAKIYFDRILDDAEGVPGIGARLEFNYGDQAVNPFAPVATDGRWDKIIVRDSTKEQAIFDLLERAEFVVTKGEVHLYGADRICAFVLDIFPRLQELLEVYCSEDFRGLQIRTGISYSGQVRLRENHQLLELSLDFGDIATEELEEVFRSLKLKKKYFRLKDGSFLDLNQPDLEAMAKMIDHLGLKAEDLTVPVHQLPKYQALYLDTILNHHNLSGITTDGAFKQLVRTIQEPENNNFMVPEQLVGVLREYQKTGYKWMKALSSYGMGGVLADDMGLGKTLQVIALILSDEGQRKMPALVVVPTSLLFNWAEEVQKFAPSLRVVVVSGPPGERQEKIKQFSEANIIVTSYPLLRRDIDLYREVNFSYCFLDEAQHIKNPDTINAKSVQQIKADNYFALTGTPIENSLSELWSIFNFIMPGYLLSHNAFRKKFEIPIVKGADQDAIRELSRQVRPFIMRRLKKDVVKELPEKIETRILADMTKEQAKLYLSFLKQAQGEIKREITASGFERSRMKILAALTRLRQICCHPAVFVENYLGDSGKMLLLQEVMENALSSGHRMLVFSQFTSMLGIIGDYLTREGIDYFYLDGSTKISERQQMVHKFNDGDGSVFLISLKAGGTGLNLTGADMVIHFDPWWNPAVENQASDRAHRIGQEKVVQVIKLITKGTIEEKIYQLQQKKQGLTDAVIQPGETFLSRMTEEELRAIFELPG